MEQLITIIRVVRLDPVSGTYVRTGKEIGWAPERPPTPEEREQRKAELRAHNDALFAEWNEYRAHKIAWEEKHKIAWEEKHKMTREEARERGI